MNEQIIKTQRARIEHLQDNEIIQEEMIDFLRAQVTTQADTIAKLREALKPFAKAFEKMDNGALTNPKVEGMSVPYTVHDLSLLTKFVDWQSARAILAETESK